MSALIAAGGCRDETPPARESVEDAAALPPPPGEPPFPDEPPFPENPPQRAPDGGRDDDPATEPPVGADAAATDVAEIPAKAWIEKLECTADGATVVAMHRLGVVSVWRDGAVVYTGDVPGEHWHHRMTLTSDGAFAVGTVEQADAEVGWGIRLRDLRGFGALADAAFPPDAEGEREYAAAREAAEPVRLSRRREIRFGATAAEPARVTTSAVPLRKILAPAPDGAVIAVAADGRAVMIARDGSVRWTMQGYAATGVDLDAAGGDRVGWTPRRASVAAAHGVCVIELSGDGKSHRNYVEDEVVGVSLTSGELLWRVELPDASDVALGGKDDVWAATEWGRDGAWLTLFSPVDGRRVHSMRVSGLHMGMGGVRLASDAHIAWVDSGRTTPTRMKWDPASSATDTDD